MSATRSPASGSNGRTASSAAWMALAVLTLINLFNYIDRYVVAAVEESLKHSGLYTLDSQFGVLATAFLLVYMCTAPVFGAYGDRPWRLKLVAAGIAAWSLATAAAGLAQNYTQLLTARASVGIGEAAYSAIAPAIIADFFPERMRGRVFAVFYAAIPIGAALGYIIGGVVDHHYGWRAAFYVAGLPGLLLAAMVLTLTNPKPGASDAVTARSPDARGAGVTPKAAGPPEPGSGGGFDAYASLLENPGYLLAVLGYAAYTFAIGGISLWMPAFLSRVRGLSPVTANTTLGAIVVVTGFVGTFVGGWIGDMLNRRVRHGYLWLCGVTMLLAAPCAYVAFTAPTPAVYWAALVVAELFVFASTSPINSVIVGDVPPASRAAAMAASIFAIHILGDVPAPLIIGQLSDRTSLAQAVLIIPVAILVSGGIWIAAARRGRHNQQ
jgi:MFS transporter, Spinster family, sphingosine-1-phosphate transporter